ncbi:hypothetical protein TYRP_001480 [Tyrophagus putrescentiae]|nr:hypothetical protein TYRP_001480 [Tyrophagus putrescentiae]
MELSPNEMLKTVLETIAEENEEQEEKKELKVLIIPPPPPPPPPPSPPMRKTTSSSLSCSPKCLTFSDSPVEFHFEGGDNKPISVADFTNKTLQQQQQPKKPVFRRPFGGSHKVDPSRARPVPVRCQSSVGSVVADSLPVLQVAPAVAAVAGSAGPAGPVAPKRSEPIAMVTADSTTDHKPKMKTPVVKVVKSVVPVEQGNSSTSPRDQEIAERLPLLGEGGVTSNAQGINATKTFLAALFLAFFSLVIFMVIWPRPLPTAASSPSSCWPKFLTISDTPIPTHFAGGSSQPIRAADFYDRPPPQQQQQQQPKQPNQPKQPVFRPGYTRSHRVDAIRARPVPTGQLPMMRSGGTDSPPMVLKNVVPAEDDQAVEVNSTSPRDLEAGERRPLLGEGVSDDEGNFTKDILVALIMAFFTLVILVIIWVLTF